MIIAYRTFRIANLDVFPSQSAAIVSYAKRVTPHLAGARIWYRQTTKFGTASLYQKADGEWLCIIFDHAADEEMASVHRQYVNAAKMHRNNLMSICAR